MKRPVWNLVIDAVSFVVFMAMISTGLILKFTLPPGSGRLERLARGGRMDRAVDLYLGLTRHEWGEIHLYLSLTFLVFLLIHLFLHWAWIRSMFIGSGDKPQPFARRLMAAFILIWVLIALLFPWIGSKTQLNRSDFPSASPSGQRLR